MNGISAKYTMYPDKSRTLNQHADTDILTGNRTGLAYIVKSTKFIQILPVNAIVGVGLHINCPAVIQESYIIPLQYVVPVNGFFWGFFRQKILIFVYIYSYILYNNVNSLIITYTSKCFIHLFCMRYFDNCVHLYFY